MSKKEVLRWNNSNKIVELKFNSLEWSGTDTQVSRELTFTLPYNPYDKDFSNAGIKLGDLIYFYYGGKKKFTGTVTSREAKAEIGTVSYTAKDFMQHLLRSNTTIKIKNMTPEAATKKICSQVGIKTVNLAKTKVNISKMIFNDQPIYDIIIALYRKAKKTTHKKYMPVMNGRNVSVVTKGISSGVTLYQGKDITSATYQDTTDNIVDRVLIFNDKYKKLGKVENKKNVSKYGVYQSVYTKEKGVNAKTAAKALLTGVTKEASIEALGNIAAVSGKSINIQNSAAKLTGKFYITSDTHKFENGTHTMSLSLSYINTMEEGADTESTKESSKKSSKKNKPKITNAAKAYYFESGTVFHSSKSCSACQNAKTKAKETTVAKIKKMKKANGKRKYKACSKCWSQ